MDQEDYACDKFTAQKVKKDFCRHCFQPKRLHELKVRKSKGTNTQPSSGVNARAVAADIKVTDAVSVLASTRHTEQQQNVQPKIVSETQLPTVNEQSQKRTHVSDVTPEAVDSKAPTDSKVTVDEQVTMDDVCANCNTDTTMAEQLSEGNGANQRRSEDVISESHQIPLDDNDSDIKDADISSYNVVASLDEGNTGNDKETGEIHGEVNDREVIKDTPSLVEELSTSHAEELPTKSCLEEAEGEDMHEEVAVLSTPLVENTTEQEPSGNEDVHDEFGLEEHTTTATPITRVEDDDHVITSTSDIVSTLSCSSVQDNTVPPLDTKQPQQMDGEGAHKDLMYNDDGQLESAETELPQSNDDFTSSLVANDPASPTLAAADNQAPPMAVNDQGFNIPVPPVPPPIRAPPAPPPPPDEEPPSPESPSGNEPKPEMLSPQVNCALLFVYVRSLYTLELGGITKNGDGMVWF